MKRRRIAFTALLLMFCIALGGCGDTKGGKSADTGAAMLSFSAATDFSEIKKLDGKKVEIIGYMATLSPVSGKYMYLMNMPYQNCPFCVPNTTQLANTMAVYAKNGKTFGFTDQPVKVTGTMKVGDYSDEYGYEYNYRIVDAEYAEVDLSSVSSNYALWQSIAADGIVAEVNSMLDYLYFVCQWTEYTITYPDENGEMQTANMYPGDAESFLEMEGPNGYAAENADGYMDGLITRIRALSPTELEDLVNIVEQAASVRNYALNELGSGNYTYDEANDKFVLNNTHELYNRWADVYKLFSEWLANWQL